MGPKHPVSFKLKKYNIWNSTLYKFNISTPLSILEQKNIIKSINHYFQYVITSKPLLRFENNCLKIKIFYYIRPNINREINRVSNQPPWNHLQIIKFENILKIYYGHPIELQLIKLNDPIKNATVLAQFIAMNLKSHGLRKI
jgi:hypothetical protein